MRNTLLKSLLLILLSVGLLACGDEDNSEPPAELTEIDARLFLDEAWSVSPNDGIGQHFVYLEPLELDNALVTAGRDGVVSLVELKEGDITSQYELGMQVGAGIGGNDKLWLLSDQNGYVVAINPTDGKQLWRSDVNSEVLTRPVVFADSVYVRTVDGRLTSLDVNSGESRWTYSKVLPALTLRGNAAPILTREWVIITQDDGRIVAIDHKDGKTVWDVEIARAQGRSEIERLIDIDGRSELYGQVLYVGSFQGSLSAIDIQRGQVLWSRDFSTWSGVTVSDDVLYVTDERSHIWAIDRFNGATLWKQDKLTARQVTRPVVYGDNLIVGDYAGVLHMLSRADGDFVARTELGDEDRGIFLPPLVKGDKIIAVLRDGEIAAFSTQKLSPDE